DIECKDSYDSNLDESTFLVTPISDSNEDEYFSTGDDFELLLHRDPSTPMMSVVSILEGSTDEPPLKENDDLFDLESKKNEWKNDALIDDLMTEHDQIFFQHMRAYPLRIALIFSSHMLSEFFFFISPMW
nr:hypothetical protein [Tanacetum cinerariifolium]